MSSTYQERWTRETLEAWTLAGSLLADALPRRWAHSQGVGDRALEVGPVVAHTMANATVLTQAAILHDIGYSQAATETGFHALDGARYLRSVGVDDHVVNLIAHHSCAAVEAHERGLDKALAEFPMGPPALVDGLIYCDMTTSPDGLPVSVDDRIAEILTRYGTDSVVGQFIARAEPELRAAVRRVALHLRHAGLETLAFASLRGDAPSIDSYLSNSAPDAGVKGRTSVSERRARTGAQRRLGACP
jgi:putative nucleotidyltransferase with HDIG domain